MKSLPRRMIGAAYWGARYWLGLVGAWLLYLVSFGRRRQANLWAFGGRHDEFADNAKYLYLWIASNRPEIEAVWITGNAVLYEQLRAKGLRTVLRGTAEAKRVAQRARLHIFCSSAYDVFAPHSGGAGHINLWHGVGIKNIKFGGEMLGVSDIYRRPWDPRIILSSWHYIRRPEVLVSTSPTMSAHFARCFRLPIAQCVELGYARLDVVQDEALRQQALTFGDYGPVLETLDHFEESYIYMPTFRDSGRDFIADALPDFARLAQALSARRAVLYIKLHVATKISVPSAFDNIRIWPRDLDIYPLLSSFDVLITDYSSVLYDYLFMKESGVILYAFDYERYLAAERDFALPFAENIIGLEARSFADLCGVIENGQAVAPLPVGKLAELRERFWGTCAGLASARITDHLRALR